MTEYKFFYLRNSMSCVLMVKKEHVYQISNDSQYFRGQVCLYQYEIEFDGYCVFVSFYDLFGSKKIRLLKPTEITGFLYNIGVCYQIYKTIALWMDTFNNK